MASDREDHITTTRSVALTSRSVWNPDSGHSQIFFLWKLGGNQALQMWHCVRLVGIIVSLKWSPCWPNHQVRGKVGRHTDPRPAINYLKSQVISSPQSYLVVSQSLKFTYQGVRLALDNPALINLISRKLGYFVLYSYESPLLTPQVVFWKRLEKAQPYLFFFRSNP